MRNLSLKTKAFVVLFLLVLLSTAPLIAYYLNATRGLMQLQSDPAIAQSLVDAVELAQTPQHKDRAALALKTYAQMQALRTRIVHQVLLFSILYSVLVVIVSLLAGYLLISRITKPLKDLTDATQKLSAGQLTDTLDDSAGGEIGSLISSFNKMVADLRIAHQQLAIAERRNTWQQVARTVAHEIKNPLTPIKLSTERMYEKFLMNSKDFPDIIKSTTTTILNEINNLQKLVDTFHKYAKFPDPALKPDSINDIILEAAAMFKGEHATISCTLAPAAPAIPLDRGQIREALVNVVKNAIEAIAQAGRPGEIRLSSRCDDNELSVSIRDNGCGIPQEHHKKLFQPYFTTKKQGNGIGLALTERIITLNGGKIAFESQEGVGTTFTFIFNLKPAVEHEG
jgi:nitrogen fixation/metabolism regulation signal transduction histidine kinase